MLVAVDTGGTKTLVASFDKDGKLGEQFRFETPREPAEYIATLSKLLIDKYAGKKVEAIVAGIPGTIEGDTVLWCGNLPWHSLNVVEALSAGLDGAFGTVPILIENDANLAGLAEARSLKTIPPLVLYITVSTGIGTGIITEGHLDKGLSRSEGGSTKVEFKGKLQTWESFASGKAIVRTYGKYARDITSKRTWWHIADHISRGLLAIMPILQPDIVIIGGSIGTFFDKYELPLEQLIHEHLPKHIRTPAIIQAKHPEQAVIYGCYYYALDTLATA